MGTYSLYKAQITMALYFSIVQQSYAQHLVSSHVHATHYYIHALNVLCHAHMVSW